jgi:TonB-linked SusC/RagA family outer membrane protein
MRKVLLLCLTAVFAFAYSESWAQGRTVTGKITSSEDGSPLPGVNVVLKGTTEGTVTDAEGSYTMNVPQTGGTLVFSFIGLVSQEIEVGSRAVVDVQMEQDVQQLTEVVITALGTKQNAREVTYSNQKVDAKDLLTSPNKNALEALRGKTAGVKITTGSGSVGASNRIVLRGEASLTGNNNALIVVDGVPIDNSATIGGDKNVNAAGENGYSDFGNRFNDIDPNNIESISILKGPAATSVYGSRAASGVLLITTKTGAKGKLKLNLNSTSSVERAYVQLKRQNQFGQGLINPDGTNTIDSGENFSWGPAFDGVVRPWTSPVDTDGDGTTEWLSRPFTAVEDQLENLFQTGYTLNNNLSLSGGDDRFTYFTSYSNTHQSGIMENTSYDRHNFLTNFTAKLTDKLSSSLSLSYANVDQKTVQEGARSFEGQNPYATAIQSPVNIPFTELRDYKNPFHGFNGYYGTYTINPYFVLNEFQNKGKINNVLANLALTYNPVANLTLSTRLGVNYVSVDRITAVPKYSYADHYIWEDNLALVTRTDRQTNAGSYTELLSNTRNIDWTSTASYTKDLMPKLKLTATGGLNFFDVNYREVLGETNGGLVVPNVYNLANSKDRASAEQNHFQRRIIGLLGSATFGWDDKIFLTYSARNDWSSTLPEDNQSFFYQAIGISAVVSDYLDLENSPINYIKLRADYGTTGKDAQIHQLSNLYETNPIFRDFGDVYQVKSPLGGQTSITKRPLIGNSELKPELTTTFEIGTDLSFFDGRIEAAYTYYKANSTDQIVQVDLPSSTGYRSTVMNIGEVQNRGHEVTLTLVPLALQNSFKWSMNISWSRNRSEIIKVSDQADDLTYWDDGSGVTLKAEVGQPFGSWKGQVKRFTSEGQPIVDANGYHAYTPDIQTVGHVQPDWIGGLVNTFSFKGVSLGVVLDTRQGGMFLSRTKFFTDFNGTSLSSLIGDRKPFVIPNSVVENSDGTFSSNTKEVIANSYLDDGNATRLLIDASFVKLREVTLGYDLPRSLVNKLHLQGLSVRLFAKNLKFWLPEENTFADPEVNGPAGPTNLQNIESSQTPPSRSYGINLNITL